MIRGFGRSFTASWGTAQYGTRSAMICRSILTRGCLMLTSLPDSSLLEHSKFLQCGSGQLSRPRYLRRVKFVTRKILIGSAVGLYAMSSVASTPPTGTRFTGRGRITLHRGEPCTSQIMFDLRPVNSKTAIWMAAGAHDSAKLTEAASDRRRVRITGTWKHGLHTGCAYVEVKTFAVESTWWNKLWKK
jgi:hypothetical protein